MAVALLVIGVAIFSWRGPVRALGPGGSGDFVLVYSSARAWLLGGNPYLASDVSRAWESGGGPQDRDPMLTRTGEVLLYPPTALAALSPLAALPWPAAWAVWVGLSTALAGATLYGVAALAGLTRDPRLRTGLWFFLAAGVWLAPAQTCIAHGQTAVAAVALVVLGQVARMRGASAKGPTWPILAGLFMGLATAIKPQVGGLFLVYEAGRLRWRPVAAAIGIAAALTLIGVGRMESAGVAWRESWTRNVADFAASGDGSPIAGNQIRYQLVNLHYPLHTFTDNRDAVRWTVYAIAGGLCLAYALVDLRQRRSAARAGLPPASGEGAGELLSLSMVAAITLMVVYHRFYDAALVVIPLGMAVSEIARGRRGIAIWVVLALVGLFIAPGAVILAEAAARGWIPLSIPDTLVWHRALLPHQAWGLLLLAITLVLLRNRPETAAHPKKEKTQHSA